MTIVAILGTTISPYLFFWQASQEVEEMEQQGISPRREKLRKLRRALKRLRSTRSPEWCSPTASRSS
jgi:Mn2+/Fe2+ NRAMP family transporter